MNVLRARRLYTAPKARLGTYAALMLVGLLLGVPAVAAPAQGAPTGATGLISARPASIAQQYPTAVAVQALASTGTVALAALQLYSGLFQLVLFDAAHNRSTIVNQSIPSSLYPYLIVAAGGAFFVDWLNLVSGGTSFERVYPNGSWTPVYLTLPSPATGPGLLLSGNSSVFYAASPGHLLAIDPTTLQISADYSPALPAGVTVYSVAPLANRLYLGGTRTYRCCGGEPFAGYLDQSNGSLVTLTHPTPPPPSTVSAVITSVATAGGKVYFGGAADLVNRSAGLYLTLTEGFLFRYNPSTGSLANLSGLLPAATPGVFGIVAAGRGIVLNLATFTFVNTTLLQQGGTFGLPPSGPSLVNDTYLTGANFVAIFALPSGSGGFYFAGGTDLSSGFAQLDAVRLSAF